MTGNGPGALSLRRSGSGISVPAIPSALLSRRLRINGSQRFEMSLPKNFLEDSKQAQNFEGADFGSAVQAWGVKPESNRTFNASFSLFGAARGNGIAEHTSVASVWRVRAGLR